MVGARASRTGIGERERGKCDELSCGAVLILAPVTLESKPFSRTFTTRFGLLKPSSTRCTARWLRIQRRE